METKKEKCLMFGLDELMDQAFLIDCIAVSCEWMFARYKTVQDALENPAMSPGTFMNSLLARGIFVQWKRYGTKPVGVQYANDFPDAVFTPIIDDLYADFRERDIRKKRATGGGLKSYKNLLMIEGLSEMCKVLLPVEQQLKIV